MDKQSQDYMTRLLEHKANLKRIEDIKLELSTTKNNVGYINFKEKNPVPMSKKAIMYSYKRFGYS